MEPLLTLTEELTDAILQKYGELHKLNLSSNGLRHIDHIKKLSSLEKLTLSCNDLIDIRPLSTLLNLKELNLSENRIMDLTPLSTLINLESLDISKNHIVNTEGLDGLKNLENLKSLSLEGNPITTTTGFPEFVFLVLPQVQEVDGMKRDSLLNTTNPDTNTNTNTNTNTSTKNSNFDEDVSNTDDKNKPVPNTTTPSSSSSSSSSSLMKNQEELNKEKITATAATAEVGMLNSTVTRLNDQVTALQNALTMQEELLASQTSQTTGIEGEKVAEDDDNDEVEESVEFPYVVLLQKWRQAFVDATAARLDADRRCETATADKTKSVTMAEQRLEASRVMAEAYKERLTVSQAQVREEKNKIAMLEQQLDLRVEEHSRSKEVQIRVQDQMMELRRGLEACRRAADGSVTSMQLNVMAALDRVADMEARLGRAAGRVVLAKQLLSQKEVQLRNDAAAIQAEKALWEKQVKSEGAFENMVVIKKSKDSATTLELRPEVEAALRAIFFQLDVNDSGTVGASLLHECLATPEMVTLMSQALGREVYNRLVERTKVVINTEEDTKKETDITWGEFLLLLLPDADSEAEEDQGDENRENRSKGFTAAERLAAARAVPGLWTDEQWGLVPMSQLEEDRQLWLQASSATTSSSSSSSGAYDRMSTAHLRDEVRRLSAERSFLLRKLSNSSDSMERRAEGVRVFFESHLQTAAYREEHLRGERDAALMRTQEVQKRVTALEAGFAKDREEWESVRAALEKENTELHCAKEMQKDELVNELEIQIVDRGERLERIENELKIARRAVTKAEVRGNSLQRDVVRLQGAYNETMEALTRSRNEQASAQGESAALRAENAAMKARVEELEQLLQSSTSEPTVESTKVDSTTNENKDQTPSSSADASNETAVIKMTSKGEGVDTTPDLASTEETETVGGESEFSSNRALEAKLDRLAALANRLLVSDQ